MSMIIIKSSTNDGINLNSEAEKSRLSIFYRVLVALAIRRKEGID